MAITRSYNEPANFVALLNRLHMRHMHLLMAIGNHGSLNKAAAAVGLTQPGASKALVEIEDALGQPLFIRSNRGVTPTDAGQCALRHARSIGVQLLNLAQELGDLQTSQGGHLRVGAIMGAVPLLTDLLSRFIARHPNITVDLTEDTSRELLDLLDSGLLDVAIGRTTVSSHPERYNSVVVRDETLAVVANPQHPMASKRRITLRDLAESRWIVYTANMPMRLLLEREFAQAGLPFPRNLIETRSAFTTFSLIRKNLDIVALLSSDVSAFCSDFDLATILPVRLYSRSEPYELITLKNVEASGLVRSFIMELRNTL